jgi:hypothetical protein
MGMRLAVSKTADRQAETYRGDVREIFLCKNSERRNTYGFSVEHIGMSKFLVDIQEIDGQRAVLTNASTTVRKLPTMTGHVASVELAGNFQMTDSLTALDHLLELRRQCAIDRSKVG